MTQVIFIHPLKTGGTSIRHMLVAEYGRDRIMPVPVGRDGRELGYPSLEGVFPLQFQRTITPEMVAGYDVVMSHYDWELVERLPGWDVITMLRNPVDQLRSLYQYIASHLALFPEAARLAVMGFEGWVRSDDVTPYLNIQTKYLSGHRQPNLSQALRNLEHPRLSFGILERFYDSVQRWNQRFGWSMTVQHRNQAEGSVTISPATRALVQVMQADDMALYERACLLFAASYTPSAQQKRTERTHL